MQKNIRAKRENFAPIFSKNTKFSHYIDKIPIFRRVRGVPLDISGYRGTVPPPLRPPLMVMTDDDDD